MGNSFRSEHEERILFSRLLSRTSQRLSSRPYSPVVWGLVVLFVVAGTAHAEETLDKPDVQPPPPIDTELSHVKNVSIIRIEESDSDDDIWSHRHNFRMHEQHIHRFGRLRVKDEMLLPLLCSECRVSPLRVYGGEYLPDGHYNVVIKGLPKSNPRNYAAEQLSRALESSFNIKIVREVREIPILTLMPLKGAAEKLRKTLDPNQKGDHSQSISTSSSGDGVTEIEYQGSLPSFVEYLEEEIGEAVVNDIKVSGQVTLQFDHESVPDLDDSDYDLYTFETITELRRRRLEDIDKGLRKYGMSLRRIRKPVKGIFITQQQAESPSAVTRPIKQVAGSDADDAQ